MKKLVYKKIGRLTCSFLMVLFASIPSLSLDRVDQGKGQTADKKILKTIIVDNYYPYTFRNKAGIPDGFSVDLIQAVVKVMGLEIEITSGTWEEAIKALESGRIDLLPMMAYSAERAKGFDFSDPHTISFDAIFVPLGHPEMNSLKDLQGKKIIVMKEDAAHNFLISKKITAPDNILVTASLPDSLRLLALNKGDAALMPKLVGLLHMKNLGLSNLEQSPIVIDAYNRPFSLAVLKGNKVLLDRLSDGLSIVKATGQYQQIHRKWFGIVDPEAITFQSIRKTILVAGAVFLLILFLLALWTLSMRKQVALRTKELKEEIQERRKTEGKLALSHERLALATRSARLGIWDWDIKKNELIWDDRMYELYGVKKEDFGGAYETWLAGIHPDDREAVDEASRQARLGERDYDTDFRIIRPDGRIRILRVFGQVIRDSKGNPIRMTGVTFDITERKQMEEALRNERKKFHLLIESAPYGIVMVKKGGDFDYLNPKFKEIFGYDLLDTPNSRVFFEKAYPDPEYRRQVIFDWKEDWEKTLPGEKKARIYKVRCSDGNERSIEFLSAQLEVGDYMTTCLDITQRLKAEEEIHRLNADLEQRVQKRTAELETANKELMSISHSIAHDFKAPLRHITGFTTLLEDQLANALDDQSRHYMRVITHSTVKMGLLIDDILLYMKTNLSELGKMKINMELVCGEVLKLFLPDLTGRKVDWNLRPLPEGYGDPAMIQMVWINLISNAVKFTGRKPEAVIEIGYQADQGSSGAYYVKDNGAGFDVAYKDKLFGLFQRLHHETDFEGTGLGLANVRRIIERHGGRIWAEGVEGEGATIYFALPEG